MARRSADSSAAHLDGVAHDRAAEATTLLSADDIDFAYGTVQVLFGISLEVHEGELLALLGTNGAGKSTLLRVIAGLAAPNQGRVTWKGEDVTSSDVVTMVHRGVILVEGGRGTFPDMTVLENLQIGAYTLRKTPGVVADRIDRVVTMFPRLAERLRTPAGSLSGGEQQQLAIAKALLLDPELLCIDELSLGLAPVIVETLRSAVKEVNGRGTTILLVEQSLNVAASLCDRAVFLEKGEVRFEGRTEELLEREDIARAVFLGGHVPDAAAL